MTRRIETATRDSDFVAIGKRSPNLISERQSGSHWTGQTSQGRVTVTNHGKELAPWLRLKIRREFIAIGLACMFILWVVSSQI